MKKCFSFFLVMIMAASLTACGSQPPIDSSQNLEFTTEDFAKIDGSTVIIPCAEAWAENVLKIEDGSQIISFNKTHNAIMNVVKGEKDIAFTTHPSEDEIKEAKAAGVELEITPVLNDAFVFLVNSNNSVETLTQEQIRQIYSGKITNWNKVGGKNQSINAIQRPDNSGSQSGMITFMGKSKLAKEKVEKIDSMDGLVDAIAKDSTSSNSIGYSYYYYVNAMLVRDTIKLIAVDGVAPTNETIKSEEYPLTTNYYAITRKSDDVDSLGNRFKNYALSKNAQEIAERVGYVGL